MPFLASDLGSARPRILVINPNSTEAFTRSMQAAITDAGLTSDGSAVDFYTAPADSAPASIEGTYDSVISTAAVLRDLRGRWDDWDGYVVACFSAHPLVHSIREITTSPAVGILEAPILLASQISARVGILTTSPRWVPLLEHDLRILHLSAACSAGVVSSGMKVLELETLPKQQVLDTLCRMAKEELVENRGASAIVLGCAGMAGLKGKVEAACGEGVRVIDPVECGVELCKSLVRLKMTTSKVGMYAQ